MFLYDSEGYFVGFQGYSEGYFDGYSMGNLGSSNCLTHSEYVVNVEHSPLSAASVNTVKELIQGTTGFRYKLQFFFNLMD